MVTINKINWIVTWYRHRIVRGRAVNILRLRFKFCGFETQRVQINVYVISQIMPWKLCGKSQSDNYSQYRPDERLLCEIDTLFKMLLAMFCYLVLIAKYILTFLFLISFVFQYHLVWQKTSKVVKVHLNQTSKNRPGTNKSKECFLARQKPFTPREFRHSEKERAFARLV